MKRIAKRALALVFVFIMLFTSVPLVSTADVAAAKTGDVNQDGKVSITDAVSVVNIILGND